MHMEFNMLRHAGKRDSAARKIMCLSSDTGAQPEHRSEHRRVNAMFTHLEPPLAHHLRTCSPDSYRRSHPCNSGGTRASPDRHEIVCQMHFPLLAHRRPFPRRYAECTRDQPVMLIRHSIFVSPRCGRYTRQLHATEILSQITCTSPARD